MPLRQPPHLSQCPLSSVGGCAGQRRQLCLRPHRLSQPSIGPKLVIKPSALKTSVSLSIVGPGQSPNNANKGASGAAQGFDSSKPNMSSVFSNMRTAHGHWSLKTVWVL